MIQIRLHVLIGILLFSGKLFSQPINPNDLVGKWMLTTDTSISKKVQSWDFKNDSVLIITEITNQDTFHIGWQLVHPSKNVSILKIHRYYKSCGNIYLYFLSHSQRKF
jgi:hypothetical protein